MNMNDLRQQHQLAALEAKLGTRQKAILDSLRDHGSWTDSDGTSWVWDTYGGTKKAMVALVRRGLVRVAKDGMWNGQKKDVYYPL